ncbi:hypothetical protein GCM10007894_19420 [Paraferrimonas haliotis]|uniref:Smp protein n=2 Tax=Paraferrimonas haliotis TaxID=2013866 RepID=A0AA37TW45_9GAMM|nr:hypothetical protein GCM10007894_18150 [Paraferrimonas haliotis]GLS83965.1 hypothetical protein GCM10007894_19420 [Paraferrimonas haliotis]
MCIGLTKLWQQSVAQGHQLLSQQAEEMSRLHIQQNALSLSSALALEDYLQVELQSQAMMQSPGVLAITVFNKAGKQVAFEHRFDLPQISDEYQLQQLLQQQLEQHVPFIEPVRHINDGDVGYVRMRIDANHYSQHLNAAYQAQTRLIPYALVIAALIGFVLARMLSFKRFKAQLKN